VVNQGFRVDCKTIKNKNNKKMKENRRERGTNKYTYVCIYIGSRRGIIPSIYEGKEKSICIRDKRTKGKCPNIAIGRLPICIYLDIFENNYKSDTGSHRILSGFCRIPLDSDRTLSVDRIISDLIRFYQI
jgi:hypothetical protein